jgi:hypothetical protein
VYCAFHYSRVYFSIHIKRQRKREKERVGFVGPSRNVQVLTTDPSGPRRKRRRIELFTVHVMHDIKYVYTACRFQSYGVRVVYRRTRCYRGGGGGEVRNVNAPFFYYCIIFFVLFSCRGNATITNNNAVLRLPITDVNVRVIPFVYASKSTCRRHVSYVLRSLHTMHVSRFVVFRRKIFSCPLISSILPHRSQNTTKPFSRKKFSWKSYTHYSRNSTKTWKHETRKAKHA